MKQKHVFAFHKSERLCSKRMTETLFAGGNKSEVSFPMRAVYMPLPENGEHKATDTPASILISVSKRHFKRAVKRNRVKRQMREAYRRHKHLLTPPPGQPAGRWVIAFLWLSDRLYPSAEVDASMRRLLTRIAERAAAPSTSSTAHE